MTSTGRGPTRLLLASLFAITIAVAGFAAPVIAGTNDPNRKSSSRELTEDAKGEFEALEASEQYSEARTAPSDVVDAGAFMGAFADAQALPVVGGSWTEVTDQPYENDDPDYRDPVWSNSGAGWGLVSGRSTAIAVDGDAIYAGMADGGVWKSTDDGADWTPLLDDAPTLSIGSVSVNPADHFDLGGDRRGQHELRLLRGDRRAALDRRRRDVVAGRRVRAREPSDRPSRVRRPRQRLRGHQPGTVRALRLVGIGGVGAPAEALHRATRHRPTSATSSFGLGRVARPSSPSSGGGPARRATGSTSRTTGAPPSPA